MFIFMRSKFFKLIFLFILGMMLMGNSIAFAQHDHGHAGNQGGEISHYTCGMHPSVRVSVENYKKGDTKCPICFMPLTPVQLGGMQMGGLDTNVISKVEIKAKELQLAGVKMEPVIKRVLFKEIRAVGRVAYDPQLAIAQDEFISTIKAYNKAKAVKTRNLFLRQVAIILLIIFIS